MTVEITWHDNKNVKFLVLEENAYLWNSIRRFFPSHEPFGHNAFIVSFPELISVVSDFGNFAQANKVKISVEEQLRSDIQRVFKNQNDEIVRNFTVEELRKKLLAVGFKRILKDFQEENVCKLTQRDQGATFSVPGAGKTTEALAFFFSTAEPQDKLLVVSPLTAFGAWDEQLVDCMKDETLSFVRLTGGAENVEKLLRENHRFLLTNYELLRSSQPRDKIYRYIKENPVYVFLDESHKIKNENTAQASAIRMIQSFPKAKLIMSGTPMPQSPKDLLPQYRFLFPHKRVTENDVIDKFQSIYVRTTAHRLGIPDIRSYEHPIVMDEIESMLYKKMRNIALDRIGTPSSDARYLRSLGKSVMRLLAFVSNPSLVAHHFGSLIPELPKFLASKDSQKIAYVCRRARELAAKGKKVLIWSSFVKNVELISSRLQDIGADYIHGGVKPGDVNDPTTREGKIRKFHDKDGAHMVLVANPAAASEGISLHKACQYAIYLDRSFNAAHFLQSQDRIHRLGMPPNTVPEMEFVVCKNTIDEVVESRLQTKIQVMADALNDQSIVPTDSELLCDYDDEDGMDVDETHSGISKSDIESIIDHLKAI